MRTTGVRGDRRSFRECGGLPGESKSNQPGEYEACHEESRTGHQRNQITATIPNNSGTTCPLWASEIGRLNRSFNVWSGAIPIRW